VVGRVSGVAVLRVATSTVGSAHRPRRSERRTTELCRKPSTGSVPITLSVRLADLYAVEDLVHSTVDHPYERFCVNADWPCVRVPESVVVCR
jgi:hypothetical protein